MSVLTFQADERFVVQKGVIFTGPSPWDLTDRARIPQMFGKVVEIGGERWVIQNIETFAKTTGPHVGESISLLVTPALNVAPRSRPDSAEFARQTIEKYPTVMAHLAEAERGT